MAKILIVDDDLETIELLSNIVKLGGHEPHSVNESRHALKAVETVMPDLILLDIMMAEITGIAICKLIKSDPNLSHIPVFMVSALSDEGTKRDAANAGANKFITKPILPRDFIQQINDTVNG
ncbi:MAG: response regulator [Anaerolineales bacterium]|jgi:CheY-like chemotaxis protein|nr:response regulator [Anaerolineales bacterium]